MDTHRIDSIDTNTLLVPVLNQFPRHIPAPVLRQLVEKFNNAGLHRQTKLVIFDTCLQVEDPQLWFIAAKTCTQLLPDDFPNREGLSQYIDHCAFTGFGVD